MRIGIDLGGTKTEIICLNAENGKEIYRHRVPTPKDDYNATIQNMARLVNMAMEITAAKNATIGIGIPGTVASDTGFVKNANSVWLNGHPLDKDLEAAINMKVRAENDANCFALSEATDGAGAGSDSVFAVIIGTGCGAGMIIDGKPVSGINGIGGEWGHNPLPWPMVYSPVQGESEEFFNRQATPEQVLNPVYAHKTHPENFARELKFTEHPGPACYCGKRGCLETWISGTGFKNDHNRVTGETISTHDIIKRAEKGDAIAVASRQRYTSRLARGLAHVINIFDPKVIVLGGGMSNVESLYEDVPKLWEPYIFSDTIFTKLKPPRHGDSSGVRGAAWLWNRES